MGVDRRIGRQMNAISGEAGKPLSALYSTVLTIYNLSLHCTKNTTLYIYIFFKHSFFLQ